MFSIYNSPIMHAEEKYQGLIAQPGLETFFH